ncbi:MAG: retropepsin-like aspartic protease [Candidatus Sulfotelmatobacter sp.]
MVRTMIGNWKRRRYSVVAGVLVLCSLSVSHPCFGEAKDARAVSPDQTDLDVKEFKFEDLASKIRTMKPGPEHDYFAGVLANAKNHIEESIQLLTTALPNLQESRRDRAGIALQTLADDYTKAFRYADAARTDDDVLTHFSDQLTPEELKGAKDDSGIMHILQDAPPQTITWDGPVDLKTERNPINSINLKLTVNGISGPWLVDTGANLSLVSESLAARLGLTPLPGVAQTQGGLTGIENPLHVAVLPTLQIGGAALHNVVLMILPDANININLGKTSYQINGIVGYPVLEALGVIGFLQDGRFEAGAATRAKESGAPMYMNGLTPLVVCNLEGKDLPFSFDTGASDTNLYVRYYREFRSKSRGWKRATEKTAGAGGLVKRRIYFQPEVRLGIGDKTAILKKVSIYTSGTGTDTEYLYGNLGQDVPANFSSYTLDFTNMIFTLGDWLSVEKSTGTKPGNESPAIKP